MSTLGIRIKHYRTDSNLTQKELAGLINVKRDALANWETDRALPDVMNLKKLAEVFQVSTDELLQVKQNQKSVPMLGTIHAGLPILAQENIQDYLELPADLDADYAIQAAGDSMIGAGILNGDLAICRQAEMAQSGQIVVAITDLPTGFSEAALRYFLEGNGDGPRLRPANPQYKELHMKDDYRIAGVMVALIRKYTPSYPIYKDSWAVNEGEWTEVIDLANQAGLKVNQVQQILATQIEIAKNLKNLD